MNRAELERRAQCWQRHRARRAAWLGGAAGLAVAAGLVRLSPIGAVALGGAVMAGVMLFLQRRAPPVTPETIAAQLNRLAPTLEESAALCLRDEVTLTLVERLQRRRLDAAWEKLEDRATLGFPPAGRLRPAAALCTAALVALLVVALRPRGTIPEAMAQPSAVAPLVEESAAVPELRSAGLEITPPAYLDAAVRRMAGLDAQVAEGSAVTWDLAVSGGATRVWLVTADGQDPVLATPVGGGHFQARAIITDTLIYQVAMRRGANPPVIRPEIHLVKAIRDEPPQLAWREPAASRTIIDPAQGSSTVTLRLSAVDDHGLAGANLVLTVAKGSGEAVKFREQHLALERTADDQGGGAMFLRHLDLAALRMEPGDELYFHAFATDRRMPEPNRTRSETRFVVLRGPETTLADPGVTLAGINRGPQYFRSQRQLIMDTERLLAERPALAGETFLRRSAAIGVDQKLLRLRYGQFLGEEFEPDSSGAPREAQGMALAGLLRGQPPEAISQAAAVERAVEARHTHTGPEREGPATLEDVRAPYVHEHDSTEAATLFNEHVKASLRGVLAAMWEAEGLLRTGRPAEALPAENRALELLQALRQADRLYVRQIGHEPAPLRIADRRLQGDLEAIPREARVNLREPEPDAPEVALAAAFAALDERAAGRLPGDQAAAVEARLVAAAQHEPESFVVALELWHRRLPGLSPAERATLRNAIASLLPATTEMPRRAQEPTPSLARAYRDALDAPAKGQR